MSPTMTAQLPRTSVSERDAPLGPCLAVAALRAAAAEHGTPLLLLCTGEVRKRYTTPMAAIRDFCRPIRAALAIAFPTERVIAEPGRYISAPAMTLVTSVLGRAERGGVPWYYLDDGVYGSYSGRLFDHCEYELTALKTLEQPGLPRRESVLAGPTCDSIDVIDTAAMVPELAIGDLLTSPMIGAYSWASATDFNSLRKAEVVVREQSPTLGSICPC